MFSRVECEGWMRHAAREWVVDGRPGIACGVDVLLEVEGLISLALQEGETRTAE